ncbi:TetR/AcrR family transcriptional regulator [Subtercola sp. YIM 133946]|uniref:TetR/AcrR family transcriptional regulator n=1 Tax=Subtercola sp. YIM 133946 TaxID=3118909 RepID=UPI002F956A25
MSLETPVTRMKSDERRELILQAATDVFGASGYVGATTAEVARAAGVSQPYVVRLFGTKEQLFLDVINRALGKLIDAFQGALDEVDSDIALEKRLALAYINQLNQHGLLLSLMHAFVLGREPVIGHAARAGFMQVYRFLRDDAGFEPLQVQEFLAQGMLINTMIGLDMADEFDDDPDVRELMECAFPEKLDLVRSLSADRVAL